MFEIIMRFKRFNTLKSDEVKIEQCRFGEKSSEFVM
jgi:hypothetical protein